MVLVFYYSIAACVSQDSETLVTQLPFNNWNLPYQNSCRSLTRHMVVEDLFPLVQFFCRLSISKLPRRWEMHGTMTADGQ